MRFNIDTQKSVLVFNEIEFLDCVDWNRDCDLLHGLLRWQSYTFSESLKPSSAPMVEFFCTSAYVRMATPNGTVRLSGEFL